MIKSLFDPAENKEVIARINKLSTDKTPLWGKMGVAQMVAHCQLPLKVAYGETELKRGLIGILFGGMVKQALLKPRPFSKNGPTHPKFIVKDKRNLEVREKLIALIERFSVIRPGVIANTTHPFFGPMTTEEWDILQWKHLDHHLRQFGV